MIFVLRSTNSLAIVLKTFVSESGTKVEWTQATCSYLRVDILESPLYNSSASLNIVG